MVFLRIGVLPTGEGDATTSKARPAQTEETLADLLEKLVVVQVDLRPVCHEGKDNLPPEARRRVTGVCEVLHSVTAELVEMLRDAAAR